MAYQSGAHGKDASNAMKQSRVHPLPAPLSLARPIECSSIISHLRHLARKSLRRFFSL